MTRFKTNQASFQQARRIYGKIFDSFTRAKSLPELLKAVQASESISSCLSADDLAKLESYGNRRASFLIADSRRIESLMRNNRAIASK